jgi:hypothetical protein
MYKFFSYDILVHKLGTNLAALARKLSNSFSIVSALRKFWTDKVTVGGTLVAARTMVFCPSVHVILIVTVKWGKHTHTIANHGIHLWVDSFITGHEHNHALHRI